MKKTIFVTVLIACFMAMAIVTEASFSDVYDYTWKCYKQEKSQYCCGCSDSLEVYFVTEFRFGTDGKIYNRLGTTQIGTWNNYEGSLSHRVYFSPAINGVSQFDFQFTDGSLFLIGGNDTHNTFCVRYAHI